MIDKEKLLKWLERLAKINQLSQAGYAIDAIKTEINKGTFDKEVTPCKNVGTVDIASSD